MAGKPKEGLKRIELQSLICTLAIGKVKANFETEFKGRSFKVLEDSKYRLTLYWS